MSPKELLARLHDVGAPTEHNKLTEAHLATLLACGEAPAALEALFENIPENARLQEVLACLAQEMVVRKMPVDGSALGTFYDKYVVEAGHPLGWLPLRLSSNEQDLVRWLPRRTNQATSWSVPFGPVNRGGGETLPRLEHPVDISAIAIETAEIACTAAVANWLDESNGRVENRLFLLECRIEPPNLSISNLLGFDLDCLNGVAKADVRLRRVQMKDALEVLYSAASTGGAYSDGHYAAYGRLEAWRSIAGLIGSPNSATFDEVAGLADRCGWYVFEAPSDWFYQVAWDVGVVVLRPDGRTLSVLAATDTD